MNTLILFRHGNSAKSTASKGGCLTSSGSRQIENAAKKILDIFGIDATSDALFASSPVERTMESAEIAVKILSRFVEAIAICRVLEWGPSDGDAKTDEAIERFTDMGAEMIVAFGHNGLWERIAQRLCPRDGGYKINEGEAFIIRLNNGNTTIETVSPE